METFHHFTRWRKKDVTLAERSTKKRNEKTVTFIYQAKDVAGVLSHEKKMIYKTNKMVKKWCRDIQNKNKRKRHEQHRKQEVWQRTSRGGRKCGTIDGCNIEQKKKIKNIHKTQTMRGHLGDAVPYMTKRIYNGQLHDIKKTYLQSGPKNSFGVWSFMYEGMCFHCMYPIR